MAEIVYKFKTEVHTAVSDKWFRFISTKRNFVADPSYAKEFIFALDGEKVVGCLGMFNTQLATEWTDDDDYDHKGIMVDMAMKLSVQLFKNFKNISVLKILLDSSFHADAFETAGFRYVSDKTGKDGTIYKIYTKERF